MAFDPRMLRRLTYPQMAVVLAAFAAVTAWNYFQSKNQPTPAGLEQVEQAFRSGQSGTMVEGSGMIRKILADDLDGDRHQRLIIDLGHGRSILIAHNIDLAQRVPVEHGDAISFRGQYEWNEQGGIVHWTHHAPRNRRPSGWLRAAGRTYD